jgi:hypothetical protein
LPAAGTCDREVFVVPDELPSDYLAEQIIRGNLNHNKGEDVEALKLQHNGVLHVVDFILKTNGNSHSKQVTQQH